MCSLEPSTLQDMSVFGEQLINTLLQANRDQRQLLVGLQDPTGVIADLAMVEDGKALLDCSLLLQLNDLRPDLYELLLVQEKKHISCDCPWGAALLVCTCACVAIRHTLKGRGIRRCLRHARFSRSKKMKVIVV
jgi:hypothetical protein